MTHKGMPCRLRQKALGVLWDELVRVNGVDGTYQTAPAPESLERGIMNNPFPKTIIDESSGIEVNNNVYWIWEAGYKAGKEDATVECETCTFKRCAMAGMDD